MKRLGTYAVVCAAWVLAAGSAFAAAPEPLIHFALEDDTLTNTGTKTLSASPSVASGFTFADVEDVNGATRRALKSTGSAVTKVELEADAIAVKNSTVSFWANNASADWRDVAGIDYILDPASSARTWQVLERVNSSQMAFYSDGEKMLGPTGISVTEPSKLQHWAVVSDDSTQRFYLNGTLIGEQDRSSYLQAGCLFAAFGFGGSAARNTQMGAASVADVRIYGEALSAGAIKLLAQGKALDSGCQAAVSGAQAFSALSWQGDAAYEAGVTTVVELTLADGAELTVDVPLALDSLVLTVPEGSASVKLSGEGAFTDVKAVTVSGAVDFGSTAIPALEISANATATVEQRSQIAALTQNGTLRLAGGDALTALNVDGTVTAGKTLAIAKEVNTANLPISGRTVNIEPGAAITVSTQFRTADGNVNAVSVVNQTGGTLTCSGGAGSNYKTGAFVLSHWSYITNYSLSGGTLTVPNSAAKLGADGTGNLTISGTGTANLHSVVLRRGTLTVAAGGTLNLGAAAVSADTSVVDRSGGALTLSGGTLGPWARTGLSIGGDVTVSETSTVRTTSAEETPQAATVTFTGTLAGAGGLKAVGGGVLDVSAATLSLTGALAVTEGTTVKLGAWRPQLDALEAGSTLSGIVPTTAEEIDGVVFALGKEVVSAEGITFSVEGWSAVEATIADGKLTVRNTTPSPIWKPTAENQAWSDLSLWSNTAAVPTSGAVLLDFRALTAPASVEIPAGTVFDSTTLQGEADAACTLTVTLGEGASLGTLGLSGNAVLPLAAVNVNTAGLTISEGYTLTLNVGTEDGALAAAITGDGAFVKAGTGTLTLNADVKPLGASTIAEGTVKFGSSTIGGTGSGSYTTGGNVRVKTGATLDIAGVSDAWLNTVTLEQGAVYANSGSAVGTGKRQLKAVVLEGDASVSTASEFGLVASGHAASALTLNGHTLTKTGAGTFWLDNTAVANGTLLVEEGTLKNSNTSTFAGGLTFSSETDDAFVLTGGTVSLDGALVKTGAGAMTFPGVISGNGALTVSAGKLTLTKANTRSKANTLVAAGATLELSGEGRLYGTTYFSNGTVTIRGTLRTTNWVYNAAFGALAHNTARTVIDGGRVVFTADCGSPDVDSDRGFTITDKGAIFEVPEGVTYYKRSGSDAGIENGGTLRLTGKGSYHVQQTLGGTVAVAEGTTLGGTGTFTGTVSLEAGAVLDAAQGALTVKTLTFPETAGSVTVKVDEAAAAKGAEVLKFSSAVDPETFNDEAFSVEGGAWAVIPNEAGTALVLTPAVTLPAEVGSDNGTLSEMAENALFAAAETLGLSNVASLTGTAAGRALTAEELSGALECFSGSGLISAGETTDAGTALIVTYAFGVAAMDQNAAGDFTVTVRVQDAAGNDTVVFAPNVTVELFFPGVEGGETLSGTPTEGASEVVLTLPAGHAFTQRALTQEVFSARVRSAE